MSKHDGRVGPSRRAVLAGVGAGLSATLSGCGLLGGNRIAWEYDEPGDTHRVVGDAVHAYDTVRSPGRTGMLRVVDSSSGELTEEAALGIAWNVRTDGERSYYAGDGRTVARAADGSVDWLERLTDDPAGTSLHGEVADLAAAGGTVYATRAGPTLTTFDAASGERLRDWSTERWSGVGDLIANVLVAGDDAGYLVVHIEDGRIYADDHQGREQWVADTPWQSDEPRNALLADGDHIAVVCETALHVHDRSGEHLWSSDRQDLEDALVALGGESVYVYGVDGELTAHAIDDGSERWTFDPDGVGTAGLAVGEDTVYCSTSTSVYALTTDGDQRWEEPGANGGLTLGDQYLYAADELLVAVERD